MNLAKKILHKGNTPILIVMTRWHAPGRCKNRLAKDIGQLNAAFVQKKLTTHTISVAKSLEEKGLVQILVAITGTTNRMAANWAKSLGLNNICTQGNGNLGTRMKKQILNGQRLSFPKNKKQKIILIGTDLPTLTSHDLVMAIEQLNHKDIVIGPSIDGGYWLIGLGEKVLNPMALWLFSGIPWGSNKVLYETIEKAKLEGVSFSLLREQNDLDRLKDFHLWNR